MWNVNTKLTFQAMWSPILFSIFFAICILGKNMEVISSEIQEDILKIIPDEKLIELRNIFKVDWPTHAHIYNFIDTTIKMKKKDNKFENYVTLYAPNGDWNDGTIVGVVQMGFYDLVLYSFDKTFARLKKALKETKIIDWERRIIIPAVKNETVEIFKNLKEKISRPVIDEFHTDIWRLPKEKALAFTCSIPKDYFVAPLNTSYIDTIFTGKGCKRTMAKEHLLKNLEANGGIGLFLKKTNELHAWVVKYYFGELSNLEVSRDFRRKGLGSLVVKMFTKKLAEEGLDSLAFIETRNKIAQDMFRKLGFKKREHLTWLYDTSSASCRKSLGF